ncbi:hypothetical protein BGZ74_009376 [Mortierella antarctica]|nr:hypothetical protein BGZ74_009376 [Mortierella antarctica]
MYDDSLNRDTTDLMAHSRLSRSLSGKNSQQNELFCEKCNGHQRVVYQLLSNYIPGEDDDFYQDYYDNADTYRRQLEERYPLACSQCLDKVQRALSKQNYKFKSNILNTALSKSRGDRISRTRTYPSSLWIIAGLGFFSSNLALLTINISGVFGPDFLPTMRSLDALKYPDAMAGTLDVGNLIRATTKLNILGFSPWSKSFGTLLFNPTDSELSGFVLALICLLSVTGLFWDPMQFVVQRWPQKRIKEHWYFHRSRVAYGVLMTIQLFSLASGSLLGVKFAMHAAFMLLHTFTLTALLSGQSIQDPIELKFLSTNVTPTERPGSRADIHSPKNSRQAVKESNPFISTSPQHHNLNTRPRDPSKHTFRPSLSFTESRPGSPDADQIDWSPRKATPPVSGQIPARFGMYRDSSFSGEYEDTTQSGISFAAAGRPQPFQERLNQATDNKFRSRAYEPSPLANPQLTASMGLGSMSLGEMFGFPSAKFQAPENHFAHRSTTKATQKGSDPWSYRRDSVSDQDDDLPGSTRRPRYPGMDIDLDEDDEDDRSRLKSYSGHDDVFSRLSSMDTSGSRSGLTFDGREAFAAQTYFPPEPETGLEDNFLGVVKIVDDYLPQSQTPRTIAGRNLMMKKHKAPYWLAATLLSRVDHWVWSPVQMLAKYLFVCVILHATVFWIVVEYQTSKSPSKEKPSDRKRTSKAQDPFEHTASDKVISYALLTLLMSRMVGVVSAVVRIVLSTSKEPEQCPQDSWVLHLQQDIIQECQRAQAQNHVDVMDWFPWVSERVSPGLSGLNPKDFSVAAGWMHDVAIIVLLLGLLVLGAGPRPLSREQQNQRKTQ